MAWNGNSDSNQTVYKNYMYNNKVFLLDEITSTNCAFLIGDLTQFIGDPENNQKKLNLFINSPGGNVNTMITIIGLLNLARLNDIYITTYVLGLAGSAASLIAVQGDMRFMSNISRHFVHFGSIFDTTSKPSEIEKTYQQNKDYAEQMQELYIKACKGKLSKAKLLELESDERGYLNAKECMKYGLCDMIIEDELEEKKQSEAETEKLEEEFNTFLKNKKKMNKPTKKKGK